MTNTVKTVLRKIEFYNGTETKRSEKSFGAMKFDPRGRYLVTSFKMLAWLAENNDDIWVHTNWDRTFVRLAPVGMFDKVAEMLNSKREDETERVFKIRDRSIVYDED